MLDPARTDFPDASEQELEPFALAFVGMMFAHAKLEREIRNLWGVITRTPAFEGNLPPTDNRPKEMRKLIKQHLGAIPEVEEIVGLLKHAKKPCTVRNLPAHGHWWRFDLAANRITVRGDKKRDHVAFALNDIETTTSKLEDIEAELFKLRRAIEKRQESPIPLVK